jgi:hypothetical protein
MLSSFNDTPVVKINRSEVPKLPFSAAIGSILEVSQVIFIGYMRRAWMLLHERYSL